MISDKYFWLYFGQSVFGLLIGIMAGLSISPTIAGLIGLLFAFLGGSVMILIKGKSAEELEVIGKCVAGMSSFMLIGIFIGIVVRANDLLASGDELLKTRLMQTPLSVTDIRDLSRNQTYMVPVCELVKEQQKSHDLNNSKLRVDLPNLKELIKLNDDNKTVVDSRIVMAWLGWNVDCKTGDIRQALPKQDTKSGDSHLHSGESNINVE